MRNLNNSVFIICGGSFKLERKGSTFLKFKESGQLNMRVNDIIINTQRGVLEICLTKGIQIV